MENKKYNMRSRDPHQSLKSEVMVKNRSGTTDFVLVKLQWGKDDISYSLHVSPNTFSMSGGYQLTDFLSHLGFQRSSCSYIDSRQCYVIGAPKRFSVSGN